MNPYLVAAAALRKVAELCDKGETVERVLFLVSREMVEEK